MKKVKIAVACSGGGTNLQAVLDSQGTVLASGEVALVLIDRPGAYALERAKAANVPAFELNRKSPDFTDKALELFEQFGIGLIITAGFLTIFAEKITKKYENRIINVHPALIPSFCGMGFYGLHVHRAALDYGVKVTGATVHYANEIVDGGRIILQKAVGVEDGDTPETLQKRVMEQGEWVILPQAAELVCKKILENPK